MESRYALREIEGAIGLDCRRLRDGRVAVFRHTHIHRRTRREFLERRDIMSVLLAGMMSTASIGSRAGIPLSSAYEAVNGVRSSLIRTAFPYVDMDGDQQPREVATDDYDVYFDELDRIDEEGRKSSKDGLKEGDDPSENGGGAAEMV